DCAGLHHGAIHFLCPPVPTVAICHRMCPQEGDFMHLRERVSNELLPYVQSPGQYIGREFNQLVRDGDWDAAQVRVVVAFPDAYTIGMSHLGCQIIYWLCNHTPGV